MIYHDIEQNTQEWIDLRLGKFTASSCADLLMKDTNKGYQNLIKKIVEERITGLPCEGKWNGNYFTERGHLLEDEAIRHFELSEFQKVKRIGFVELEGENTGCSPDGLIGDNVQLQIKCPIFSTQMDYLESEKIDSVYYKQMQFELMVTGREYNIFYSYHPSLPPVQKIVNRDEEMIQEIKDKLIIAEKEVQTKINKLKAA